MLLIDKINKIKFELNKIQEKPIIIVEGKNDKKQLEKLGFNKDNIIMISGNSLIAIVNNIKTFKSIKVIILTDFDRDGEKTASQLVSLLQKNHIAIDHIFRKKFKSIFNINKIEEIKFFTKQLENDFYGEITPIHNKLFSRRK